MPQAPDIKTTSNLVIVPALVSSASRVQIPDLHASDFLLTDNGIPQMVRIEDAEHRPISLLVLMQTGGAPAEQFPLYTKLSTMLSYMTSNVLHEVAMVEFDSQPEYVWSFTRNVDGLDDAFEHPDPGDGGAAILDAIRYGIGLLNKRPAGYRRVILLISQAHDEKSHVAVDEIVRQLGENNITIECLTFSPEGKWLKKQLTQPSPENKPYQFAPDVPPLLHTFNLGEPLAVAFRAMRENTSSAIATLSGGESFPFSSKKELDQQLATLANHFAATYMLSFRPTSKQPGFHSLHLQVAGHPELQVSARTSYWASDESSSPRWNCRR
ncbi:MAG TPA: VWA domain-containing protein [Acidobacteriaceae bacterium]|nr:VWA domain-containing protein [Acidobacteriaceae bacterium]